jgi:hypothetical protein
MADVWDAHVTARRRIASLRRTLELCAVESSVEAQRSRRCAGSDSASVALPRRPRNIPREPRGAGKSHNLRMVDKRFRRGCSDCADGDDAGAGDSEPAAAAAGVSLAPPQHPRPRPDRAGLEADPVGGFGDDPLASGHTGRVGARQRRTMRRWRWLQIRVRSSSSRRHRPIQRCRIASAPGT